MSSKRKKRRVNDLYGRCAYLLSGSVGLYLKWLYYMYRVVLMVHSWSGTACIDRVHSAHPNPPESRKSGVTKLRIHGKVNR